MYYWKFEYLFKKYKCKIRKIVNFFYYVYGIKWNSFLFVDNIKLVKCIFNL